MDGNLVPGTRVLGLGDKLEAVRDVEGPPSLVAIWAGGTGVTRLAAVAAETGVEAAAAFLVRTILVCFLTLDYPAILAYPVIYSPTRIPSLFSFAIYVIRPDELP